MSANNINTRTEYNASWWHIVKNEFALATNSLARWHQSTVMSSSFDVFTYSIKCV